MGEKKIPRHVAVILDGNGRWAKKKGRPRTFGHVQGAKTLEAMCETFWNHGIEYLTVYAFSTENWKRSEEEVGMLMNLLREYMKNAIRRAVDNNMKVRVIGDLSRLAPDLQESIHALERASDTNTGLKFTIAINYGGRDEITRAVRRLAAQAAEGTLQPEEITEQMISESLDTAGMPDPDLLIRTSGEERLSNFLPWQLAYTEFYFTPVLWPDFDEAELVRAIDYYNGRDRRFGGVHE